MVHDFEPVAIIGMSGRFPGANDIYELWANILAQRQEFRPIPAGRLGREYRSENPDEADRTYLKELAVMEAFQFDWIARRIPKRTVEATDVVHWVALEMALAALDHAGLDRDAVPRDRTGVVIGNSLTGEMSRNNILRLRWPYVAQSLRSAAAEIGLSDIKAAALESTMETVFKDRLAEVTEDTLSGSLANTIAGRICNYLDLHGGGYTVDGACSSSLLAVATAARYLQAGEWDLGLAGGVDVSLDPLELVGFAKTQALTRSRMRVFDERADGFVPGEGCGFIVLKRLSDARRDGDYVWAILRGVGISSDGQGGLTQPQVVGQQLAFERARRGLNAEIDFLEAHGTGTAVGDRIELETLRSVLANSNQTSSRVGVTSLKSLVGHMKAAAGVGGLIKATLAVNRRIIPPMATCERPNPVFGASQGVLYPVNDAVFAGADAVLRAGVSAMGFGGINTHLILESGDPPTSLPLVADEQSLAASSQDSEIIPLSAPSRFALLQAVRAVSAATQGISYAELSDYAAEAVHQASGDVSSWRAAIVTSTPQELHHALGILVKWLESLDDTWQGNRDDKSAHVLLGHNPAASPKVGIVFSGQGSQVVNAGRWMLSRFEWARDFVEEAFRTIAASGIPDLRLQLYPDWSARDGRRSQAHLNATEYAQPAIVLTSLLWCRFLQTLGVSPSVVAGHSLGELPALWAAGGLTAEAVLRLATVRGQAMGGSKDGAMLALRCSASEAKNFIEDAPGYAVIGVYNSPAQTIMSGERQTLERISTSARQSGIPSTWLPVSNAFHSHLVSSATAIIAANVPPGTTRLAIPFLSGIDARLHTQVVLQDYLSSQVEQPVHFDQICAKLPTQCDLVVEVGATDHLAVLARENESNAPWYSVERIANKYGSLHEFLAAFFIAGGAIEWKMLDYGRWVKPFKAVTPGRFLTNACEGPTTTIDPISARETGSALVMGHGVLQKSPKMADDPEFHVLTEIAEVTGYPVHDIQSTHRLVKDLGFDSFKLAQLWSRIFDTDSTSVPDLGTATVGDMIRMRQSGKRSTPESSAAVIAHLQQLIGNVTSFPVQVIEADTDLVNDLHMDSLKVAQLLQQTAIELEVTLPNGEPDRWTVRALADWIGSASAVTQDTTTTNAAWVRVFSVEWKNQKLPPLGAVWDGQRVCILADDAAGIELPSLVQAIAQRGGIVQNLQWNAAEVAAPSALGSSVWLALLSAAETQCEDNNESLRAHLAKLAHIAAAPTTKCLFVAVMRESVSTHEASSNGISAFVQSLYAENRQLRGVIADVAGDTDPHVLVDGLERGSAAQDRYWRLAPNGWQTQSLRIVTGTRDAVDQTRWSSNDVVIVSGGAKGITLECARTLARRTGIRLALLGRTLASESTVHDTLRRLADDGIDAQYFSCDIVDMQQVEETVAQVAVSMGRITGVIHGAGVNFPRRAHQLTDADIAAILDTKIRGALNLYQALAPCHTLKMFAALTSVIGLTGMHGEAWYGLANEQLTRYLERMSHQPNAPATKAIGFSVWSDVGMGASLGVVGRLAQQEIHAIPPNEGSQRFSEAWLSDGGPREVLVSGRLGGILQELPRAGGYIERIVHYTAGVELVTRVDLSLDVDTYLRDHQHQGRYLFPAVLGIEAMAQAAFVAAGLPGAEISHVSNVKLDLPVAVSESDTTTVEMRAIVREGLKDDALLVDCALFSQQTAFHRAHFQATYRLRQRADIVVQKMASNRAGESPRSVTAFYGPLLFQGPAFQRISQVYGVIPDLQVPGSRGLSAVRVEAHSGLSAQARMWEGRYLTGDPFARDAMFQAVQFMVPESDCLPVKISEIDLSSAHFPDESRTVVSVLTDRANDTYKADVFASSGAEAREVFRKVELKIVGHRVDVPHLDDHLPSKLTVVGGDNMRDGFDQVPELWEVAVPQLHLLDRPDRRQIEQIVWNFVSKVTGRPGSTILHDGGRPVLWPNSGTTISISHDDVALVLAIGSGKIGCDTVTIDSSAGWSAGLPEPLQSVVDRMDGDQASSREQIAAHVWAQYEALYKIAEQRALVPRPTTVSDDRILWDTPTQSGAVTGASRTVRLCGIPRVVAVAWSYDSVGVERQSTPDQAYRGYLDSTGQFLWTYRPLFADVEPGGYVRTGRLFEWMGHVRELALAPLLPKMVDDLSLGRHAFLTRTARIRVLAPIRIGMPLTARLSLLAQPAPGTALLGFQWATAESGTAVAEGEMEVIWLADGLPRFPTYMEDFLARVHRPLTASPRAVVRDWTGTSIMAQEMVVESGILDTNLIGNTYFSAYHGWQDRLADMMLRRAGLPGLHCVSTEMQYLHESRPGDLVKVQAEIVRCDEGDLGVRFVHSLSSVSHLQVLAIGKQVWRAVGG